MRRQRRRWWECIADSKKIVTISSTQPLAVIHNKSSRSTSSIKRINSETHRCKYSLTFKKNLLLASQTTSTRKLTPTIIVIIIACTDVAILITKIISLLPHPFSVTIATLRCPQSHKIIPNHSRQQLSSLQLRIVGHSSKS